MIEKRFSETERNCYYTSLVFDNQTQEELGTTKAVDLLNELYEENKQLKGECDALQNKTEMDKNDFFISEAKRMRLLAFIEDNGLRKEYYEWERRIWNE